MKGPILADTSVWVDFFKGIENRHVEILAEYIENDGPLFLCPTIIQEILQGVSNDRQYRKIKDHLLSLNILNDDGIESVLNAADIYRSLRKKGVSIRKSNDCLIAHYALKYSIAILHRDRDFDMILSHYK